MDTDLKLYFLGLVLLAIKKREYPGNTGIKKDGLEVGFENVFLWIGLIFS